MKRWEERTIHDIGSKRELRATRFANCILSLMRDFLPSDRECQRRMYDYLAEVGYKGNVELINVPPECDELDKIALERKMYETKLATIEPHTQEK